MRVIDLGNFAVNQYAIPLPKGYLLVDTGYEGNYAFFCRKMAKNNIQMQDIRYLFLTHAHDDHAGFLNQLLLLNPTLKVILHPKAVVGLRKGQNSFNGGCSNRLALLFCKAMALVGKQGHRFPPVEGRFAGRYILTGTAEAKELERDLAMQFIETPGHTECSISLLYDKMLFCGDAAMNGLPSWNKVTIWIENLADYQSSWKKMLDLQPQLVYPGHGKPFPPGELAKHIPTIQNRKLLPL